VNKIDQYEHQDERLETQFNEVKEETEKMLKKIGFEMNKICILSNFEIRI